MVEFNVSKLNDEMNKDKCLGAPKLCQDPCKPWVLLEDDINLDP